MPKISTGVYKIQSIATGRFYIGSSCNIAKRFSDHLRELKGNRHHNKQLQRLYNKYGKEDLFLTQLIHCSGDFKIEMEQRLIDHYLWNKKFLNENKSATYPPSRLGCTLTQAQKDRQKERTLRGEKHPLYGKPPSQACIDASVAVTKGRKLSEETRKKMSLSRTGELNHNYHKKGNTWRTGRPLSEEHKRKIGEGNKGKVRSEEVRKAMSEIKRGRKISPKI